MDSLASRTPFFFGARILNICPSGRGPKMGPSPLTVLFKCLPIHQDGTSMMTTTWWWCNFQKGTQIQIGWAKKNQKAITCKNYDYSNNKHNSRLIDPGFKVQIGYLTVNRQTNKQMGGAPQPNAPLSTNGGRVPGTLVLFSFSPTFPFLSVSECDFS